MLSRIFLIVWATSASIIALVFAACTVLLFLRARELEVSAARFTSAKPVRDAVGFEEFDSQKYFYFALHPTFKEKPEDVKSVRIEVEYYTESIGTFSLQ